MSKRPRKTRFRDQYARTRETQLISMAGLIIFSDGGCEPNPGAGGWSYVVYRDGLETTHDYGGSAVATNNQMELQALIEALEWVSQNAFAEPVTIYSDSTYTVNGAMSWRLKWRPKGWKKKGPGALANVEQWQAIDRLLTGLPLTQVAWCKGHAGIAGNVRADELASRGRGALGPVEGFDLTALDREYTSIMKGTL